MAGRRLTRDASRDLALAFLGAHDVTEVRMAGILDRHIKRVLEATDDNLSLAAELLGVNRRTMQRLKERERSRRKR
jgi:ActR/RegA family two-component response regulator